MLLRAHVAGALDLGKADTLDPRWWKKVQFIINELDRTAEHKLDEYEYQLTLSLIDYSLDTEHLKMQLEAAEQLCNKLESNLKPWEGVEATTDLHDVIADMKKRYIEVFGDPDTPEFQAKLAKTIAYLNGTT